MRIQVVVPTCMWRQTFQWNREEKTKLSNKQTNKFVIPTYMWRQALRRDRDKQRRQSSRGLASSQTQ